MAFDSHASYEATDDAAGFFFAADAGPLTATARMPVIASAKMRILNSSPSGFYHARIDANAVATRWQWAPPPLERTIPRGMLLRHHPRAEATHAAARTSL